MKKNDRRLLWGLGLVALVLYVRNKKTPAPVKPLTDQGNAAAPDPIAAEDSAVGKLYSPFV